MAAIAGQESIQNVQCASCGDDEYENLTIHHINPDTGHKSGCGGNQHLYKCEQDFVDRVPMQILCKKCHSSHHDGDLIRVTEEVQ